MKHSTFLATALGFFASLSVAASSYNEVQLTFTRNGTAFNTVDVKVADENGTAIDGVTAKLVSLKKTGEADCTLMPNSTVNYKPGVDGSSLAPAYGNTQNGYMTFLFKITGLSDFMWNKCAIGVLPVNSSGQKQSSAANPRKFTFDVNCGSESTSLSPVATLANENIVTQFDADNCAVWHDISLNGTKTSAPAEMYLQVKITKTSPTDKGCFVAINKITLSKVSYPVTLAETTNVGYAATFSAEEATTVPKGVNIYKVVTSDNNSTATLTQVEGSVIPAGQGVILLSNTVTSANLYATTTVDASAFSDNELIAIPNGGVPEVAGKTLYVFTKNNEGAALFKLLDTTGDSFAANKACLGITPSNEAPATIRMSLDNNLTGIGTVANEKPAVGNNTLYDLTGRRMTKPAKGQICISSGRKILVK